MRTRRSNRTKSYVTQTYDFLEGSEAEGGPERPANSQDNEVEDQDFAVEEGGASPGQDQDDEEEFRVEDEEEEEEEDDGKNLEFNSDSDIVGSDSDIQISPRYRRHDSKGERPAWIRESGQYLSINPAPTDTHVPRGYAGYFDRNVRGPGLVRAWYGPDPHRLRVAAELLDRWVHWSLLPPKETAPEPDQARKGIWSADIFERESAFAERWLRRVHSERPAGLTFSRVSTEEAQFYSMQPRSVPVLVGPSDSQVEVTLAPGQGVSLSESGLPFDPNTDQGKGPTGWLLDVGGTVVSLDWVPRRRHETQILALSIIPFEDQQVQSNEQQDPTSEALKHGVIQIWEFESTRREGNTYLPSAASPRIRKTIFTDQGRVRRIKWNPACNHLAILSTSGIVRVVDFDDECSSSIGYERLNAPLATLAFVDEVGVKATCMTWVNVNRLAVGYSDGTIALWSVYPQGLISRHPAHHAPIIDIASGYPTMPYLVASTPMGGYSKIVDLRAPSYETTEVPTLAINLSPSLMCWSDHLLGFFSITPSSHVLNTIVAFLHYSSFPIARRLFTGERFITSLAVGRTHPFLLIGTIEGSLWALNPQFELIHAKRMLTDRVRVFQHEHRPGMHFADDSPARQRGASRIIQGFRPEQSLHARSSDMVKKKKRAKAKLRQTGGDAIDVDDSNMPGDPTKGVLDEPLNRVTAIEWNPNEGWGTWAAVALGSGLVKIMELGLDGKPSL